MPRVNPCRSHGDRSHGDRSHGDRNHGDRNHGDRNHGDRNHDYRSWRQALGCIALLGWLSGCTGVPAGITPVTGFELERYLGKWYEIARLDHSFERGLQQVSAEYSTRAAGGIRVLNRGYSSDGEWQSVEGRAYFVGDSTTAHLKVSFFGPFYGSYVVFELDKEAYQYAFIAGNTRDYLWFLSRTPRVSPQLQEQFLLRAQALGFDTDEIIFVDQSLSAEP